MWPLVGWRFAPFDKELIKDYLVKRVRGDALPCDCEVYGKKPLGKFFILILNKTQLKTNFMFSVH